MKKLLSLSLALCLLVCLAACGSEPAVDTPATDKPPVITPGLSTTPTDLNPPSKAPTPLPEDQPVSELAVNGIALVRNGQLTGIGYKGTTYEEGVLTLSDGFSLKADGVDSGISFTGPLTIVVEGAVVISSEQQPAIVGEGDDSALVIKGGSLTVSSKEGAAIALSGSLTVDACALLAEGSPAAEYKSLVLEGGAAVANESDARLEIAVS